MGPIPIAKRKQSELVDPRMAGVISPDRKKERRRQNGHRRATQRRRKLHPSLGPGTDQGGPGERSDKRDPRLLSVGNCCKSEGQRQKLRWPVSPSQLTLCQNEEPSDKDRHCSERRLAIGRKMYA